ncbi:LRR domain containing protein [Trema orientale]|uniref:LRR domain containing protein n=1 Tax=Trema orientale TaxID=63057 RepID=A0A2P5F448_TREOI|nr:LRR domain containing protein [Trema orientale]
MKLEDLNKLNHLKGRLRISGIGWTKDVNQAERAQLNSKDSLVALELEFRGTDRRRYSRDPSYLLLEGLQPHPNLKHLEISFYYGTNVFPHWMSSLTSLKRLVLRSCSKCQSLGPFGKLLNLESLSLQDMFGVKKVDQKFLGVEDTWKTKKDSTISLFPKLKRLEFRELRKWNAWESYASLNSSLNIMPHLVSLEIIGCSALKPPLPEFLLGTPLEKLSIRSCRLLEQHFQEGLGTKDVVKILTSSTLDFVDADIARAMHMVESETCKDDPQTSGHGEISQVDEDEKAAEENNV